jgi:hypothetical protein
VNYAATSVRERKDIVFKISIVLTAILLTGCGTHGTPLMLAKMYNSTDPCQRAQIPSWCGAGSGKAYIYDMNNNKIGYAKK